MPALQIQPRIIAVEETYHLRQSILRPHQTIEECKYPFDLSSASYHLGCFQNTQLLGIGSILPDPRLNTPLHYSWRIRGMAVLEEARGMGIGSRILQALITHVSTQPGEIWCNGRVDARSFYERQGFVAHGSVFDTPPTGPHLVFIKDLA